MPGSPASRPRGDAPSRAHLRPRYSRTYRRVVESKCRGICDDRPQRPRGDEPRGHGGGVGSYTRTLDRSWPGVEGSAAHLAVDHLRSEEHTSEIQSLMRTSYAVLRLKKKKH